MITTNFELYVKMPTAPAGEKVGDSHVDQTRAVGQFDAVVDAIRKGRLSPMPESVTLLGPNGYVRRWRSATDTEDGGDDAA